MRTAGRPDGGESASGLGLHDQARSHKARSKDHNCYSQHWLPMVGRRVSSAIPKEREKRCMQCYVAT